MSEKQGSDEKCVARPSVRVAIEELAESKGIDGVCTAWIVIAEIASHNEHGPTKTLLIDHAYHDDTRLAPWTAMGLMMAASAVMEEWPETSE